MPSGREELARQFYGALLGLPEVPKPSHLASRGGAWFESGDVKVHLGVDPDFRPAKKAHPGLLVSDLGTLTAALRRAGHEVQDGEPLAGYVHCYVDDPFGNRLELMERLMPKKPQVECEQQHPSLYVGDVTAAVDFYTNKLGFRLAFTSGEPPTMAGVNLGQVQMFLEQGTPGPQGCSLYFVVDDADALFEFQRANGVEVAVPPDDRPYGLRDYAIRDLHGYRLSFGHRLLSAGPPLNIERVDVPVRLEKRLAALLHDLAGHKGMSLSSCLEEILLHTCEPLGDGVASPHTRSTLVHIQELKKKHGIDYDSHASYRFVEG